MLDYNKTIEIIGYEKVFIKLKKVILILEPGLLNAIHCYTILIFIQ